MSASNLLILIFFNFQISSLVQWEVDQSLDVFELFSLIRCLVVLVHPDFPTHKKLCLDIVLTNHVWDWFWLLEKLSLSPWLCSSRQTIFWMAYARRIICVALLKFALYSTIAWCRVYCPCVRNCEFAHWYAFCNASRRYLLSIFSRGFSAFAETFSRFISPSKNYMARRIN